MYTSTDGRTFSNLLEALDNYGISKETFNRRMHLEWKVENCIETAPEIDYIIGEKFFDVHGNIFKSINEAAKAYETTAYYIQKGLAAGYSMKDTLMLVEKGEITNIKLEKSTKTRDIKTHGTVVVAGVRYRSLRDACTQLDTSYYKALKLVERGFSLEEAVLNSKLIKKTITLPNGETFNSVKEAMEYLGVSVPKLRSRMKDGKTSSEQALANIYYELQDSRIRTDLNVELKKKQTKPILTAGYTNKKGKMFKSIESALKDEKISTITFVGRLCNGWSVEDAIEMPVK